MHRHRRAIVVFRMDRRRGISVTQRVRVRFKNVARNPCPQAIPTPEEHKAWEQLKGKEVTLIGPIESSKLLSAVCGSNTYWEVVIDENILAAASAAQCEGARSYAICRHVLDIGD